MSRSVSSRSRRRPLAREARAQAFAPAMSRSPNERLAVLEQKVSHMEAELDRMSGKVDEMHAVLMQARGVRWAIIAVSGLVGFLVGHRALVRREGMSRASWPSASSIASSRMVNGRARACAISASSAATAASSTGSTSASPTAASNFAPAATAAPPRRHGGG
jgi:hypothetical protein